LVSIPSINLEANPSDRSSVVSFHAENGTDGRTDVINLSVVYITFFTINGDYISDHRLIVACQGALVLLTLDHRFGRFTGNEQCKQTVHQQRSSQM
jgi:hypothetical protein